MSRLTNATEGATPTKGFSLDHSRGKLMGVCSGIGRYFGMDPLWIRIGFVSATLLGFGFPVLLYLAIGLIAD